MVTRSNRRNTKGRIRFRAKLSLSLHLSLSLSLSLFASIHNRTSLAAFSFIRESKERNSLSLSLSLSQRLYARKLPLGVLFKRANPFCLNGCFAVLEILTAGYRTRLRRDTARKTLKGQNFSKALIRVIIWRFDSSRETRFHLFTLCGRFFSPTCLSSIGYRIGR